MKFITIRLGKDSIPTIKAIDGLNEGIQKDAFSISVKCTQVPPDVDINNIAFIWLGSDNSKGMQTEWKQGFKAIGVVTKIERGEKYIDESTTTLKIVYVFSQSIGRIDVLEKAPDAYYCCSSLPIIGLDDRANQTIRSILNEDPLCDVGAFLFALNKIEPRFFQEIIGIVPEIKPYFSFIHPKTGEKKMAAEDTEKAFNRILFGAPGTGKSWMLNKCAVDIFESASNQSDKDEESRIKESIQNAGSNNAARIAVGLKYSSVLAQLSPKKIHETYSCSLDAAYGVFQGTKIVTLANTFSQYEEKDLDAEKIKAEIKKIKKDRQASWAAIGYRYSSYLSEKTTGDIQEELDLSRTASTASWIVSGANSKDFLKDNILEKNVKRIERVTFHPNYSYAQFVGTYKPVQDNDDAKQIVYKYVPGPFMRIYCNAKRNPNSKFLLLIEEINRANVAAVFGDVFQLLDRNKDGFSEYPVVASEDIKKHLKDSGIDDCEVLRIPDNMCIWATMNSADQGVFPMDTAFKRRWEFEYIDIDHDEEKIQEFIIPINISKSDKTNVFNFVRWNALRKRINAKLTYLGINEDKLMGPFFLNMQEMDDLKQKLDGLNSLEVHKEDYNEDVAEEKGLFKNTPKIYSVSVDSISEEQKKALDSFRMAFCGKVLMYLFEDAAKMKKDRLFSDKIGQLRFSNICNKFKDIGIDIFKLAE